MLCKINPLAPSMDSMVHGGPACAFESRAAAAAAGAQLWCREKLLMGCAQYCVHAAALWAQGQLNSVRACLPMNFAVTVHVSRFEISTCSLWPRIWVMSLI